MSKTEKENTWDIECKQRIAKGSGKDLAELNQFLKQFEQMKSMMKMMNKMPAGKGMPGIGRR